MDFNRTPQTQAAPSAHVPGAASVSKSKPGSKLVPIAIVIGVFAVVVLLVGIAVVAAFGGKTKAEDSYVDTSKLQAVFLETGQVYFGNIKELNSQYFVLTSIYYLQTSSSSTTTSTASANTSVSLVKLGCELHAPYDQMVINRSQVTFWENLQSNGQVATAVANFQKENPNGQKCSDQSAANTTGSSSVQGTGTATSPTTTTKTTTATP
jgi:hypothetical protein